MSQQEDAKNESTTPPEYPPAPSPIRPAITETEQPKLLAEIANDKEKPPTNSKRHFGMLELLALIFDGLLVVIGVGALCIYNGQLAVMRGTLTEMQRSGQQSTEQVWRAIDNINWMAHTQDQSSKDTLAQMKSQSLDMRRSADAVVSANRAWIVPGPRPQNKRTIQEANLEWNNAGRTPAVAVFSTAEYFVAQFPQRLRTCPEMERALRAQPLGTWQYQPFVAQDGRYETGLANTPPWNGPAPLDIHGCVWYTDILSNTERTTEFFYEAFHGEGAFPPSVGISIFYLQGRPFIYK